MVLDIYRTGSKRQRSDRFGRRKQCLEKIEDDVEIVLGIGILMFNFFLSFLLKKINSLNNNIKKALIFYSLSFFVFVFVFLSSLPLFIITRVSISFTFCF